MCFKIYFTDTKQGCKRMRVCVSSSEEELRNTTVEELKRKLVPEDQLDDAELLYKHETLKKNRTLGFYGIKHEDEIIAVRRGTSITWTPSRISLADRCSGSLCLRKRRYPEDEDEDEDDGAKQCSLLNEEEEKIIPRTHSMDNLLLDMQQPRYLIAHSAYYGVSNGYAIHTVFRLRGGGNIRVSLILSYDNTELLYNFNTLKKNRTLGFYGIKHEDVIFALHRETKKPSKRRSCNRLTRIFDDDDDEDKEMPRTQSLEHLALMQQPEPPVM